MASMLSRSPARSGFTCAQTNPRCPLLAWYSASSFSAVLVTAMRVSASALASGGSFCANTSWIAGAHSSRSLCNARLARYGLVVTPTAPRARPRSSSAASAESCHQMVAVFSITHWRYVFCIIVSCGAACQAAADCQSAFGIISYPGSGGWQPPRRMPSCPTFQLRVILYLDDTPQHPIPGGAIRPHAHGGRFFVADDGFLLRVPSNRPAQPQGHVREVARRRHAMSVFHLAQRPFARADAVEPVAFVHGHGVFAAGAVTRIAADAAFGRLDPRLGLDRRVDRPAGGMTLESRDIVDRVYFILRDHFIAAAQHQAAFGAEVKLSAGRGVASHGVGLADRASHGDARERPDRVLHVGRLAVVLQGEAPTAGLHQGRPFDVHDPHDLVDQVGAEIGHLSARVIPEPAEMVQAAVRLIRPLGRRPEPHIVVEISRRVLHLRLAESRIDIAVDRKGGV